MIKSAFVFAFMFLNSISLGCDFGSFVKIERDIPSENTCELLILKNVKNSCNESLSIEVKQAIESKSLQVSPLYAGNYCFLEVQSGIFKITTDWMAEPPVATVIYSLWD